jgi:hypothetical protein
MSDSIRQRLLFILHRGWVEARLLAMKGDNKQAEALADMLEIVPAIIAFNKDDDLAMLRQSFAEYSAKFASRFDYHVLLDTEAPEAY